MQADDSSNKPDQLEAPPADHSGSEPDQTETLPADTLTADYSGSEPTQIETQLVIIEAPEPPRRYRRISRYHIRFNPARRLRQGAWVLGIGGLIVLAVLALTTPSWGSIATRDGIGLLIIGACAGCLILLQRLLEQHWARRRWPIIAATLLVFGMLGIALAPVIHTAQAHLLEHQGNYQRAIDEYSAGGEHQPNGDDIARCYLEWGQQDLNNQNYAQAIQHLGTAAQDYQATPSARQAREPMGKALLLWGRELVHEQNYAQAIQQFARLRKDYADTAAAQQAQEAQDEPAAYYAWGQMLQASQNFQAALQTFQAIGKLFPNSSYVTLAFNASASDLYDWGQALIRQGKYKDALTTYQQLIKQYSNTLEAQQAQQDLAAPQAATGRLIFVSGPPDANVIIRLSSSWSTSPNGYLQGGYVYETHTDANGQFVFSAVPPGMYLIDWQEGNGFTTLLHPATYNPVYIADIEPLHSADLGDILVEG